MKTLENLTKLTIIKINIINHYFSLTENIQINTNKII